MAGRLRSRDESVVSAARLECAAVRRRSDGCAADAIHDICGVMCPRRPVVRHSGVLTSPLRAAASYKCVLSRALIDGGVACVT